jgi:hypothetical protein
MQYTRVLLHSNANEIVTILASPSDSETVESDIAAELCEIMAELRHMDISHMHCRHTAVNAHRDGHTYTPFSYLGKGRSACTTHPVSTAHTCRTPL